MAPSRRGLLLGAAAAAAATLVGEQQAQAVQGLTAGRLPGKPVFPRLACCAAEMPSTHACTADMDDAMLTDTSALPQLVC